MISVSVVVASHIKTKLVVTVVDFVEADRSDDFDLFTCSDLPGAVGGFACAARSES